MRQHAPRGITILVATVLVLIGILATFFGIFPNLGGIARETIGVVAYIAAAVVMLAGIFVRGL